MLKKVAFAVGSIGLLLAPLFPVVSADSSIARSVAGRIVIDVERNGEAWYVHPLSLQRHYLGRPHDAVSIMRNLGLGITNQNLNKIQIGLTVARPGVDSDGDGLSDNLEKAIGTDHLRFDSDADGFDDETEIITNHNPLSENDRTPQVDRVLASRLSGRILLQVEARGEAWYVNPVDNKRYYLGKPEDALAIMRELALGINTTNLSKIAVANQPATPSQQPSSPNTPPREVAGVRVVAPAVVYIEGWDDRIERVNIAVKRGQDLEIYFINRGTRPHNLKIDNPSRQTPVANAGETVKMTLDFLEIEQQQSYTIYSSVDDDRARGMEQLMVIQVVD